MKFRPCIDIHNGQVKQIVGGSLSDDKGASENFVSALDGSMQALGLTVSSGRLCVVYKKTAVAIAEGGAEV